jgi:hypothetical protein
MRTAEPERLLACEVPVARWTEPGSQGPMQVGSPSVWGAATGLSNVLLSHRLQQQPSVKQIAKLTLLFEGRSVRCDRRVGPAQAHPWF